MQAHAMTVKRWRIVERGEPRHDEGAPKGGQPGQEATEVVTGGGEHSVGGVAVAL